MFWERCGEVEQVTEIHAVGITLELLQLAAGLTINSVARCGAFKPCWCKK